MATFGQIASKTRALNINSILTDIFKTSNLQKWMIETIQNRLYSKGETGEGIILKTDKSINDSYSPVTMDIKSYLGQRTENVTLKDTGDFYESFKVVLLLDGFEITGDFVKGSEHIEDNFNNLFPSKRAFESSVMSLTDKEINYIVEKKVIPLLLKEIHEFIRVN